MGSCSEAILKELLCWQFVNINFGFKFCYEVVYPADHDFIFFLNFHIRKNMYSPKGWLNASRALSHMLVPSAQRWAGNRCCGGATAIIALPDQLRVAAIGNQNGNQNGKTNIPWQHHICQLNEVYSDILYECSCGVWKIHIIIINLY